MDFDPLQDSQPPRYAIESDDSEDEFGKEPVAGKDVIKKTKPPPPQVQINVEGISDGADELVVAVGEAGNAWSFGVEGGEGVGGISVDGEEIASVLKPTWAGAGRIVVLVKAVLPVNVLHPVAAQLLAVLKPKRLTVIDEYASPAYISSARLSLDPPIKYLTTSQASTITPRPNLSHFSPPNLIQTLSAPLITLGEVAQIPSTAYFLPLGTIPSPPSKRVKLYSQTQLKNREWNPRLFELVHGLVFGKEAIWDKNKGELRAKTLRSRVGDIGEGGMYI